MIIAVSSTGPGPADLVDPRFGRCRYYLLIDSDSQQIRAVDNTSSHAP
jgi:predicted Fe-Mo cluster-binding NifX family protein